MIEITPEMRLTINPTSALDMIIEDDFGGAYLGC
jgi:hypothetical protein